MALGDVDRDGAPDLLLSDLDGQPILLLNRTEGRGRYLRVRAPLGSRVEVWAGGLRQVEEVRSSGSYLSASEQVAHFGMGGREQAERVRVTLPGGRSKEWTNVRTDRTITATIPKREEGR